MQTGEQIWLVLHVICPTKVTDADFVVVADGLESGLLMKVAGSQSY